MTTLPTWVFDESPIADPLGLGERAVKFLRALKHPKTGKPFQLDRWQERIVRRIYGPRHPDGMRIVRSVVMMIARGGRKTTLGAALALLHTIGPEREPYGQVVLAAYDRAQARIAFDEALGIVQADPRIVAATSTVASQHRITHRKSHATLKAVSADAAAQNGRTPSFVLFDEIHAWRSRQLYDVLRTGLGKTAGTLSVVISQAGRGAENVAHEVFDYARRVARGEIDDPGTLPILFESPRDVKWNDEAAWFAVNPGLALGYPDLASLRQEAREAENRPALREKFKNDHLCVWLDHSADPFVDMATYDAGAAPLDLDALKGRPCWLGVDLSSTRDLTAIVAAWRDDDGTGFIVKPWFFCPRDNLQARADNDRVPYPQWAEEGFIDPTPGNVVDFRHVEDVIRGLCADFDVREIAFDPHLARNMLNNLLEDGLPAVEMRQGWVTMAPAVAELERAIIGRKLQHGGNPILRWHFENVAVETDIAAENDRTLTADETAAIKAQADAYVVAKDRIDAFAKAQEAAKAQASFFGNEMAGGIEKLLEGTGRLGDIFKSLAKDLEQAALKAALLGEGPLAGIFGSSAASNGQPGGIIGGLFGSALGSFGRSTSGGAVAAPSTSIFSGLGHLLGFASGGEISGPGTGTSDSIVARVSHGEFIVNAKAAQANLGLLHAMNAGKLPAFATGGQVGATSVPTFSGGAAAGGAGGFNQTNHISVQGNGGTQAQNADLAKQIGDHVTALTRQTVMTELRNQMRPGNLLQGVGGR